MDELTRWLAHDEWLLQRLLDTSCCNHGSALSPDDHHGDQPMHKSKSAIAEDAALAAQIATAKSFSAFLLFGPHDRRKVLVDEGGPQGYARAVAAADQLNTEARQQGSCRSAIIYAINSLGSFDVTPEAARQAGLVA